MPVSLALCWEQVETLSEKSVLGVTWEPRPGLAGDTGKQSATWPELSAARKPARQG